MPLLFSRGLLRTLIVMSGSRLHETSVLHFVAFMAAAMTSFEESSTYWGMFPTLAFEDTVTVTGGCLKRGAQVAVRRFHGRLFVLVVNSEWVSQAALGASRSRSGIRRTCSIDKLRECAIERAQMAVVPLSALEDDPMKELEQHCESGALGPPPSKRRRLPLAGLPPACVHVPAHLVDRSRAGARLRTLQSRFTWVHGRPRGLLSLCCLHRCPRSLLTCATS